MSDVRLLIDKMNLDEELITNPQTMQDICDECAEAIAIRDAKKETLDTVDAELDSEIRKTLSETSTKATEPAIKNMIQTHQRHKKAFEEYNNAKLAAAKAMGLEKAFETRSKNMESLSKLYISGYFAINHTKRSTEESQYNQNRQKLADMRRNMKR